MKKRWIALAMALTMSLGLFVGCGGSSGETSSTETSSDSSGASSSSETTAAEESSSASSTSDSSVTRSDKLSIYAALPESELPAYMTAFEEDTGIKVEYVRLSAGEILAKLQAEGENPGASL